MSFLQEFRFLYIGIFKRFLKAEPVDCVIFALHESHTYGFYYSALGPRETILLAMSFLEPLSTEHEQMLRQEAGRLYSLSQRY